MKNGEYIIDVLGDLDSKYIEEYILFENKKRFTKHNWTWKSAISIAACITLIIGGLYSFSMSSQFQNIGKLFKQEKNDSIYSVITKSTETSADSTVNTTADGKYIPKGKVIDNFKGNTSSACYIMPPPGTYFCFKEVNDAFKKYSNENATYFLGVVIFSSNVELKNDSTEMNLELTRLQQLGYHIGYATYWTYDGTKQKVDKIHVAGYFTQEEIEKFIPNSTCGYMFGFMANGDDSPMDSSQGIITNFTESTGE